MFFCSPVLDLGWSSRQPPTLHSRADSLPFGEGWGGATPVLDLAERGVCRIWRKDGVGYKVFL